MAHSLPPSGPQNTWDLRAQCEGARKRLNMAKVRGLHYLPKSKDMWQDQYLYSSQDRDGNYLPLTGEKIDELLVTPTIGREPQIFCQIR